ncbi:MAG: PAC2 family protein [Candidatus Micrarchaeia archaeon]
MKVEIIETAKAKTKRPVIIEGFPGIGMIGTISASYLAQKLDAKLVGYIASPRFPPISAIHDYKPVSPARVYASEKHDVIILFSEFVIPADAVYHLAEAIHGYAKKKKARAVYSLAGIASPTPGGKIRGIASTPAIAELLKKNGVELIKEGATQGVSGLLIAECASEGFPAANLLSETNKAMDPAAAATLLEKLSQVTGIPADTRELRSEGKKIEYQMKGAMNKMQALHADYKKLESNPMYS